MVYVRIGRLSVSLDPVFIKVNPCLLEPVNLFKARACDNDNRFELSYAQCFRGETTRNLAHIVVQNAFPQLACRMHLRQGS
jgi:hypothetical protein